MPSDLQVVYVREAGTEGLGKGSSFSQTISSSTSSSEEEGEDELEDDE